MFCLKTTDKIREQSKKNLVVELVRQKCKEAMMRRQGLKYKKQIIIIFIKYDKKQQKLKAGAKNGKFVRKIKNGKASGKLENKSNFIKKCQAVFSGYLSRIWEKNTRKVEIIQQFDETKFQNILLVMFGKQIEVERSQIGEYFEIAQFLQIDSLVGLMKDDIIGNIEDYNIFVILGISQQYSDQELFELCLEQLHKQQFQQISYHQFEFLHLKLSLFRFIMKMHNKYKLENGIDFKYLEIDALIKRYCDLNHLPPDIHQTLKFQLIHLNSISSKDYKRIFLDQHNHHPHCNCSDHQISSQMKLRMENTFQKKRNNQLTIQNNNLRSELQIMKTETVKNIDFQGQMEKDLKMLRKEMDRKQEENIQLKKVIAKYESMLQYMQNELQQKTSQINVLVSKFEQIKEEAVTSEDSTTDKAENNTFAQSQYLPSHFIQEIMSKHKNYIPLLRKGSGPKEQNNPEPDQEIEMIL